MKAIAAHRYFIFTSLLIKPKKLLTLADKNKTR
jgi:hypothetical protein